MSFLPENWFSVSAAIAVILSILPIFNFLHQIVSSKRQFKVKNLELLFQAFDKHDNPAMRLVVEQQFQSIFRHEITFEGICILLSNENPSRAIQLHKNSLRYLEIEGQNFKFNSQYLDRNLRVKEYFFRPIRNFIWYMVFAFPAASLGVIVVNLAATTNLLELSFSMPNVVWYSAICVVVGLFARLAYNKITDAQSIAFAEELLFTFDTDYSKSVELTFWHNANKQFKSDS